MAGPKPVLLVYRELVAGDLRKLKAESNDDSSSGGGARDLRLPWRTFRPIMHQMFDTESTGKGGKPIRTARIIYKGAAGPEYTTLEYWPATESRPSEDRVAKVHSSPAIGGRPPALNRGRIFTVFIKWFNGDVTCGYAYEEDLRSGTSWHASVSSAILSCMRDTDHKNTARRRNPRSVQGYCDFLNGTGHCHVS